MSKTPGRPIVLGAFGLLLAGLVTACQSAPPETAADLTELQGRWEGSGPGGDCSVTISGNSLSYFQPARDPEGADFWYETTFTLPAGTEPKQLHATILENSSPEPADIGRVVVVLYEIQDETLTLGVIDDFEGPSVEPVIADWDQAIDRYHLERTNAEKPRS